MESRPVRHRRLLSPHTKQLASISKRIPALGVAPCRGACYCHRFEQCCLRGGRASASSRHTRGNERASPGESPRMGSRPVRRLRLPSSRAMLSATRGASARQPRSRQRSLAASSRQTGDASWAPSIAKPARKQTAQPRWDSGSPEKRPAPPESRSLGAWGPAWSPGSRPGSQHSSWSSWMREIQIWLDSGAPP